MSDARERLIILYFNAVPGIDAVSAAVSDLPGVAAALLARTDEASRRADMWRRDPLQCLPTGRLALDFTDPQASIPDRQTLSRSLGGFAYHCQTRAPLELEMAVGETFSGTLQLCCFHRRRGIDDRQLRRYWFDDHTEVAVTTQNTLGYFQNWVLSGGGPDFDGIVEEYFPAEASQSMTAFFADGHDETLMWGHVERLTASSERFLDLERTEVIHLTDTRIL